MTDAYKVIIRPVLTEKSVASVGRKKYTFEVALDANKVQIAEAIEALFPGTEVAKVNTMHVRGKERRMSGYGRRGRRPGRTAEWKKAIVTLSKGTIPVFEGT